MEKLFKKSLELSRALFPAKENFGNKRCYHYSFLYSKNRLVAVAENKINTTPRNLFNLRNFPIEQKGTCSEMSLFIKVKNTLNVDWKKLTMINVRIDRNGEIRNSRPCNSCSNLVKYLDIRNIYFTTNDGTFEKY